MLVEGFGDELKWLVTIIVPFILCAKLTYLRDFTLDPHYRRAEYSAAFGSLIHACSILFYRFLLEVTIKLFVRTVISHC